MLRKKTTKKERIKLKMRVQLKNDISSDGIVIGKGAVKAQWKVEWAEGPLKGSTTDQSSKSIRAWQLNLAAIEEQEESSSGEEEEEEIVPSSVDYAGLKRKFEAHAKSVVGKKVEVSPLHLKHISNLTFVPRRRSRIRALGRFRGSMCQTGPALGMTSPLWWDQGSSLRRRTGLKVRS
jgi:hypothetical protein